MQKLRGSIVIPSFAAHENIMKLLVLCQKMCNKTKCVLWCLSVAAFNQLGYRLSPQFAQLVVMRYDPQAKQRLTLDNFIQACVLLKSVTDTFRGKDKNMSGVIQISYEEFLTMVLCNKP